MAYVFRVWRPFPLVSIASRRVLAKTALRRSRSAARRSQLSLSICENRPSSERSHKKRKTNVNNNASIAKKAYALFYSDYSKNQSDIYKDNTGKVAINVISSRASVYWADPLVREIWFKEAHLVLGVPYTSINTNGALK